jgi:DNA mismatch repair protein MutH
MRTEEAIPILKAACGTPFKELFKGHPADLTTNKGHAGQLLERYVGLELGNHLKDFEDGELKTNKTSADGDPLETIAVTQIKGIIDDLLADPACSFERSPLCEKLNNLLVVPVVKNGPSEEWYLLDVYQIDLSKNSDLRRRFAHDYRKICSGMRESIETIGRLRTTNGHYLQIRTKDSKPYKPIFSEIYSKYVSTKNYAFYLQKCFMRDVVSGVLA